jgi:hypothetical protein
MNCIVFLHPSNLLCKSFLNCLFMGKTSKIIATIFLILIYIVLAGAVSSIRGEAGLSTPGPFGIALFFFLCGALSRVWDNK